MGCKRIILASAQREVSGIVAYLAEVLKSPSAARSFMDEFDRKVALACENPQLYALSRIPELAARGYRVVIVKGYVMLYKHANGAVVVAHVFHQSQNYTRIVTAEIDW